jgi:hypothetical protein
MDTLRSSRALLLLLAVATTVLANMRAPSFGKMRWGQDRNNLYITAFIPGVSVTDEFQEFTINNTHFHFEATNPANSEVYKLSFEFREEMNASAVVQRHHTWKYGNSNNSLFALIPKQEPHLFDRLHFQKPTKELKFAIEKDWDRYTVSDDMMEDDDDDEQKTVKDGLTVLTDDNFDAMTADKKLTVFRVHFPWCSECKSHDHLTKAARSKRGKRLAKKYGVLFGVVDPREERRLRRTYSASCKGEDGESQECMDFLWTKYPGQEAEKWSSGGTKNHTELLNKVLKIAGPSPHQLTATHEVEQMQKDSADHFMAVGFFDKSKHAEQAAVFEKVASGERRQEMMFAMIEESKLVGSTAEDLAEKLLKTDCYTKAIKAPAVVVLKHWNKGPEERSFAVFGDFAPQVRQVKQLGKAPLADHVKEDEFTEKSVDNFIADNLDTNLRVLPCSDSRLNKKPEDHVSERTRIRMFVADAEKSKAQIGVLRCAAQMLHREASFIIHDEKAELGDKGKIPPGANMSDATMKALLDYGAGGAPRPLLVMDQLEIDKSVSKYVLRMENSANYIVKQIRRATFGHLTRAVKSEPAPANAPRVGQVGSVVGSTLGGAVAAADTLLLLYASNPGQSLLPEVEANKVAEALKQVGSDILVVTMDHEKNHCNASDAAIPDNLECSKSGVHFIRRNHNSTKYSGVQYRAAPMLQFINDNAENKFDVVKAQEHVTFLDKQCTVTLHQHGYRDGQSAVLRVGRFDLAAMVEAGAKNDDVSSVTVSDGCQVTLYENGDFTGWNATFSPGKYNVNQMEKPPNSPHTFKNDATSSVVVQVYIPPKPPVQVEAPVATAAENGNVNLTWAVSPQEEEASKPTRYEVYGKRGDSASPHGVMIGSTAVKGATEMHYIVANGTSKLAKGVEYSFEVQPFSAKAGAGSRSPPSNVILWGDSLAAEATEAEAKPAKDEV